MSQTANAEPEDRDAFTCGTLLMCLCLPGFSKKKKPEQQTGKSQQQPTTTDEQAQSQPAEHAQDEPDPQTQLESFSLYSGSNIVFDFLVEPGEGLQGYCPSPCFDLPPAALIRAGELRGAVDVTGSESETPATPAALAFDGYRGDDALKRMASCLPSSGVSTGGVAEEPPAHLVRFLPASGSRPQVT